MDYRSRILAAIDHLRRHFQWPTSDLVALEMQERTSQGRGKVARELRAMAKAGIVVYDRKASGWRRA